MEKGLWVLQKNGSVKRDCEYEGALGERVKANKYGDGRFKYMYLIKSYDNGFFRALSYYTRFVHSGHDYVVYP